MDRSLLTDPQKSLHDQHYEPSLSQPFIQLACSTVNHTVGITVNALFYVCSIAAVIYKIKMLFKMVTKHKFKYDGTFPKPKRSGQLLSLSYKMKITDERKSLMLKLAAMNVLSLSQIIILLSFS